MTAMQITVHVYITASGDTRAFLLRDAQARYPGVIGVGRSLPAAVRDYADCFNAVQSILPEEERIVLSPSDVLPSRRVVRRFPEIWSVLSSETFNQESL